jgi:hypothetical protein
MQLILNYRHQFPQEAVIPYTFAAIYHTVKTYILNKQSTNTLALQKRNIDPMFNLKWLTNVFHKKYIEITLNHYVRDFIRTNWK